LDTSERDLLLLDRPEVLSVLFYPRKEIPDLSVTPKAMTYFIEVEEKVRIGCRFYPARKGGPTILYFHGNGETALDYDYVAPLYAERGINLFVTDYRGYGYSNGSPGATHLIRDAQVLFEGVLEFRCEVKYLGPLVVMGRSLGSAPAIEVAWRHQGEVKGLIVESGFARTANLLAALGLGRVAAEGKEFRGFGNDEKIATVSVPTLVIHGERDRLIPVSEGVALYECCGAKEKTLLVIPGADHNDLMIKGEAHYFGAIEELGRNLEN
jgi:alpha-beta hydrolase superfamily lysophospholipase